MKDFREMYEVKWPEMADSRNQKQDFVMTVMNL
jgi:hypothetical protein